MTRPSPLRPILHSGLFGWLLLAIGIFGLGSGAAVHALAGLACRVAAALNL